MKDGKVSYVHNWVGKERYTITAPEPLAPGRRQSATSSPTRATNPVRAVWLLC